MEEYKNTHYQLRKKAASESKWELKKARESSLKTEVMWNQGWVGLNLFYCTEMPSLRRKKQYVNLCLTQEAELEHSVQLLRAEQGPEGIAAAPAN